MTPSDNRVANWDLIDVMRKIREAAPQSVEDVVRARNDAFEARAAERGVEPRTIYANCVRDRILGDGRTIESSGLDRALLDWVATGEFSLRTEFEMSFAEEELAQVDEWRQLFHHDNEELVAIDIDLEGETRRIESFTRRIIRDTKAVKRLKRLHRDRCQLCGHAVELRNGGRYSEGHHIKPLGMPHHGPDIPENIVILCPNHHAQCDFGAIRLVASALRPAPTHQIEKRFIDYHNEHIAGNESQIQLDP